jgi:uncharacterized protein with FMN-binding domain
VADSGKASKKVANSVVALSSAAIVAVYGAGYARTRAAADRFAQQAADRRPHIPTPRGTNRAPTALTATADTDRINAQAAAERSAAREAHRATAPQAAAAVRPSVPPAVPTPAATPQPPTATSASAAAPATTSVATTTAEASAPVAPSAQPSAVGEATAPVPVAQAPAPAPTPAPVPQVVEAAFTDGTYYGWGSCRHGDIQAAVTILEGKITEARVERCLTRYSCSWVTPIPPRILARQGTTYDYVSGATESSDAFQDAVAEALSKAKP